MPSEPGFQNLELKRGVWHSRDLRNDPQNEDPNLSQYGETKVEKGASRPSQKYD